jgi:hypothetical protein
MQVLAAHACLMQARDQSGHLAIDLALARHHFGIAQWLLLASKWLPLQVRRAPAVYGV